MSRSRLDWLASLPKRRREKIIRDLPRAEQEALAARVWEVIARPEQRPPSGSWSDWWVVAGRGYGKSRTGSEFMHERVRTGSMRRGALVGATAADCRDVMVEGESGILATARKGELPKYEPSKRRVTFPNGAVATTFSADEPERLRGPEHDTWWCDEPGTWRYGPTARDNLAFGARIGDPRGIWTTTPRNVPLVRDALASGALQMQSIENMGGFWQRSPFTKGGRRWVTAPTVRITRGTTYENLHNLAESFASEILDRYEGTRLGAQELLAQLLDDLGTFFARAWFLDNVVEPGQRLPSGMTVVRYWDLAATPESDANPDPDWTAGALVGLDHRARRFYILDVRRIRAMSGEVEDFIAATAREDGRKVHIGIEQEPGSSGKSLIGHYKTTVLRGWVVKGYRPSGPKDARAAVWAGYAEQRKVHVLRERWLTGFLDEAETFDGKDTGHSQGYHDDQIDAVSGAFGMLLEGGPATTAGRKVAERSIQRGRAGRR